MQQAKASHIAVADAIRALAIFAVVVAHLGILAKPSIPLIVRLGTFGVNGFFVLTGYLLSRRYLAVLIDGAAMPSAREFYRARFLRIWPLYALSVILTGALAVGLHQRVELADVAAHLVFLQGGIPAFEDTFNGPLWTMPVDAEFYALLPVLAVIAAAMLRQVRRGRVAYLVASLVLTSIGALVFRFEQGMAHPLATSGEVDVYYRNVVGMWPSFALGIALALGMRFGVVARSRPAALLGISLACFFIDYIVTRPHLGEAFRACVSDLFCGIAVASLFAAALHPQSKAFAAFVSTRVIALIAATAYAIYLFHLPVLRLISVLALHGSQGIAAFIALAASVPIVIVPMAYLLYRYVELPFLRMKDQVRDHAGRAAVFTPAP